MVLLACSVLVFVVGSFSVVGSLLSLVVLVFLINVFLGMFGPRGFFYCACFGVGCLKAHAQGPPFCMCIYIYLYIHTYYNMYIMYSP